MAVFPTAFDALTAAKSIKVYADNGTQNGWVSIADIIAQIRIADIAAELLKATDNIKEIASTTTSYTLLADDNGKVLRFLNSGACTVNVPAGLPVGYTVEWSQRGAGILTFQAASGSGQLVDSPEGLRSGGQKGTGTIRQDTSNGWLLSGYTQV